MICNNISTRIYNYNYLIFCLRLGRKMLTHFSHSQQITGLKSHTSLSLSSGSALDLLVVETFRTPAEGTRPFHDPFMASKRLKEMDPEQLHPVHYAQTSPPDNQLPQVLDRSTAPIRPVFLCTFFAESGPIRSRRAMTNYLTGRRPSHSRSLHPSYTATAILHAADAGGTVMTASVRVLIALRLQSWARAVSSASVSSWFKPLELTEPNPRSNAPAATKRSKGHMVENG